MNKDSKRVVWLELWKDTSLLSFLLVLAILIVISSLLYVTSKGLADDLEKDLHHAFDQQKLIVVKIASSRVGDHIDNNVPANVRLLGQFPAMQRSEVENAARDMEKVNTFAAPLVDGFVKFDAEGDFLSAYPKEMVHLYQGNHSKKAYFSYPKVKETLYFSDWIHDEGKLKILVSHPIYNTIIDKNFPPPTNAFSGVLMAQVDFDKTVVTTVKSLDNSGVMHWIVDENSGALLYHSVLPRVQSKISQPSSTTLLAQTLLGAFNSSVLAPGLHHTRVDRKTYTIVSSRSRVGPHSLIVNLAYDDADVELLIREKTDRIYMIGIVFLLMVLAVAVIMFKQLIKRKTLAAHAENLAKELQLRKEKKQLSEQVFQLHKMESLGELAAGTAHELNNALSEPMGMISIMQMEPDMPNEMRHELLDRGMSSLKQARTIVDGLLRFSRSEKNEKQLDGLNADIRFVLEMHQMEIDISGIQVNLSLHENVPDIFASHRQIQQVILNLISNARYAMAGGGKLFISTRMEVRANQSGVAICLLDSGCGMDVATQQRIFEPFYSTKPVGEGTGLGLSICYGIIHDHGGELSVQSEIGEGSEFTVWLPVDGGEGKL